MIMINLSSEWETKVATRTETRAAKMLTPPHLQSSSSVIVIVIVIIVISIVIVISQDNHNIVIMTSMMGIMFCKISPTST